MPEGDYWSNEAQPTLSQTKVSIQSDAQLDYKGGQQIEFFIDPTTANFIDPKATTLQMKVKISLPEAYSLSATSMFQRLQLDGETGANILCKDWRCHTGDRSTLLEEVIDANVLCSVKYDYETNDSYKHKRALTEGCTSYDDINRSQLGGSKTAYNCVRVNPYMDGVPDRTLAIADVFDNNYFITALVEVPIQMGIFTQNRLLPLAQLGGLRLTLTLEDNKKVFRRLDPMNRWRNINSNPTFHGTDVAGTPIATADAGITTLYFKNTGNLVSVENCPFVIGENIEFVDRATLVASPSVVDLCVFTPSARITGVEWDSVNNLIVVTIPSATATGNCPITACAYSTTSKFAGYEPIYEVSDAQLIVAKVEPPAENIAKMNAMMKESGKMVYDFLAYTNYKSSQLKENRVANIRLPINNQRCKSIICVPVDSSVYSQAQILDCETTYQIEPASVTNDNWQMNSNRPSFEGISDHITDYQWVYDNKMNPSRPIKVSNISGNKSVDAQHIAEIEKGLSMSRIEPSSLLAFNKNFIIARALALQDGVYDARDGAGDFNLQVNYQETTAPTKDKLWHCFVAHIRRINISASGVSLEI